VSLVVSCAKALHARTHTRPQLDLAKGLEYLHYGVESGYTLIHDDLNPEQILLNANRFAPFFFFVFLSSSTHHLVSCVCVCV